MHTSDTPSHAPAKLAPRSTPTAGPAFVHRPRPAIIPRAKDHSWQRRFGGNGVAVGRSQLCNADGDLKTEIEVFRSALADHAEVTIELGERGQAKLSAWLTAADLRALAASLIDAAHDLETFSAAELTKAVLEGGAP